MRSTSRETARRSRCAGCLLLALAIEIAAVTTAAGAPAIPSALGALGRTSGIQSPGPLPSNSPFAPTVSETSIAIPSLSQLLGIDPVGDLILVGTPNEGTLTLIHGSSVVATLSLNSTEALPVMIGAYDPLTSEFDVGLTSPYPYASENATVFAVQGTTIAREFVVPRINGLAPDPAAGSVILTTFDGEIEALYANSSMTLVSQSVKNAAGEPPPLNGLGPLLFDSVDGAMYIGASYPGVVNTSILTLDQCLNLSRLPTIVAALGTPSLWEDATSGTVFFGSTASPMVAVLQGGEMLRTISLPGGGGQGAFDTVNKLGYVLDVSDDALYVLNTTAVTATLPLGTGLGSIAVDTLSGEVYVTEPSAGTVAVIDGTALLGTIPAGTAPSSSLFDPSSGILYVLGSSTITAIQPGASNQFAAFEWWGISAGIAGAAVAVATIVYWRRRKRGPVPAP